MMHKSQFVSTDIYSDSSIPNDITLKLDSIDSKCLQLFLNPEGSDFKIYHLSVCYSLHRAIVFKFINLQVLDKQKDEGCLQVPDEFNAQLLKGVLACLYGMELTISKSQVFQALDIIYFLKISKLKKMIEENLLQNFEDYQIFPLLEKSRTMGMQEIQQKCFLLLEQESFEQLRYQKYGLLSLKEDVFKIILTRHNQKKWEDPTFGLSDKVIYELIQEYCKHNNYNERQKSLLQKSFNQMLLQSQQFSFDQSKIPSLNIGEEPQNTISIKVYTPRVGNKADFDISGGKNYKSNKFEGNTSRSVIMTKTNNKQPKLSRRNRWSEHNQPLSKLCTDVMEIKQGNNKMKKQYQSMKDDLQIMENNLSQKLGESQNGKLALSEIQILLEQCQKSMMEINRNTSLLDSKIKRLISRRLKESDDLNRFQQDAHSSSSESDEDGNSDENKPQTPQDPKLKISLIQSRYIVV